MEMLRREEDQQREGLLSVGSVPAPGRSHERSTPGLSAFHTLALGPRWPPAVQAHVPRASSVAPFSVCFVHLVVVCHLKTCHSLSVYSIFFIFPVTHVS